jgi:hypothetical protein
MHCCHVKLTNSERLSDTVHFHHKEITNPSITPADKLMQSIADCKRAILGYTVLDGAGPLHHLRAIFCNADDKIMNDSTARRVPRVDEPLQPRTQPTPAVPRVPQQNPAIIFTTTPAVHPPPTKRIIA